MGELKDVLTVQQLADFLQYRRETILRKIYSGEIVASKLGKSWRILKTDVIAYMEKNKRVS